MGGCIYQALLAIGLEQAPFDGAAEAVVCVAVAAGNARPQAVTARSMDKTGAQRRHPQPIC